MKRKLNIIVCMIILMLINSNVSFGGKPPANSSAPKYYSFDDLRREIRKESFYFQNENKPANALVSLGYYLDYPACAAKNAKIGLMIKTAPAKYSIDSSHVYSHWQDNIEIPFAWDTFQTVGLKGDLIFSRGNGKGPDFIKLFSNWTHVAIAYDLSGNSVLESIIDSGVKVNNWAKTHSKLTYYTCKRLETLPYIARCYLVNNAHDKFIDLPYFPKMSVTEALVRFIFVWSDKEDLSSMYCSKLAYQTFKNQISIDTGRTSVPYYSSLVDKNNAAPGGYLFSWIGVSPDDIYYLPSLGPDFCYSANLLNLNS